MFLDLLLYIDIYNFCLLVGFVLGEFRQKSYTQKEDLLRIFTLEVKPAVKIFPSNC